MDIRWSFLDADAELCAEAIGQRLMFWVANPPEESADSDSGVAVSMHDSFILFFESVAFSLSGQFMDVPTVEDSGNGRKDMSLLICKELEHNGLLQKSDGEYGENCGEIVTNVLFSFVTEKIERRGVVLQEHLYCNGIAFELEDGTALVYEKQEYDSLYWANVARRHVSEGVFWEEQLEWECEVAGEKAHASVSSFVHVLSSESQQISPHIFTGTYGFSQRHNAHGERLDGVLAEKEWTILSHCIGKRCNQYTAAPYGVDDSYDTHIQIDCGSEVIRISNYLSTCFYWGHYVHAMWGIFSVTDDSSPLSREDFPWIVDAHVPITTTTVGEIITRVTVAVDVLDETYSEDKTSYYTHGIAFSLADETTIVCERNVERDDCTIQLKRIGAGEELFTQLVADRYVLEEDGYVQPSMKLYDVNVDNPVPDEFIRA